MTHVFVLLSITALVVLGACHVIRMFAGAYRIGEQWEADEACGGTE